MGKLLVAIGLSVAALGGLVVLADKLPVGLRPFHLPGDLRIERDNFRLYVLITTMVLLSLLVTGASWLVRWWRT